MALRVAAAAMARSVTGLTSHPAVFVRGFAGNAVDIWDADKVGPPVQSKRPAYDANDPAHTDKWLEAEGAKAPIDMIAEVAPIGIVGDRVSCKSKGACMDLYGERMGLGAPHCYYQLNSTTPENPVKCKYCGLRFFGIH